jgi:hypothetical protein
MISRAADAIAEGGATLAEGVTDAHAGLVDGAEAVVDMEPVHILKEGWWGSRKIRRGIVVVVVVVVLVEPGATSRKTCWSSAGRLCAKAKHSDARVEMIRILRGLSKGR